MLLGVSTIIDNLFSMFKARQLELSGFFVYKNSEAETKFTVRLQFIRQPILYFSNNLITLLKNKSIAFNYSLIG